ncbi:MAG TPA: carboxypeptidase regulatory-like domain-containing protein [Tepidisphaeraceae bacterium]|nr:carboxypeptidase regulatory-like domain-containing protein [Tepidisphaeraceae bacterium]
MRPENSESENRFDRGDLLNRAAEALRDLPTPNGPSRELIARTQAALRRAQTKIPAGRLMFLRPTLFRVAAMVAVVCGSTLGYWTAARWNRPRRQSDLVRVDVAPDRSKPDAVPDARPRQNPLVPSLPPSHSSTTGPALEKDPAPPPPAAPILADGILTGRIVFDGAVSPPRPMMGVNMTPECIREHGGAIYDESMVVGANGTLANVVVSVSDGLSGWLREEYPPPPPAVLDQKGCVFVPHVVPVMVGQQLLIRNSDPFLHNVRVMAVNNPPANLGQPSTSESQTAPFESPEVFRVKCDVHPWMQAWVRVVDNPFFAVTGRDGLFTIRGLPPGTYTLKAWHEQLGVKEQQIVIVPGEGADANFTFHAGPR